MNHGVTVEPSYDADGNYVDSVIKGHPNDAATDHTGQSIGWQNDLYEDEFGNTHHLFEDTQLADPSEPTSFDFDDYQTTLEQSIPGLYDAIQWSADSPHFSDEELIAYNHAIDTEDLSAIHAFIERLMPLYQQALEEEGLEIEEETFDEFEDDEDTSADEDYYQELEDGGHIDGALDYLMDDNFSLTDTQQDQLDAVTYAYEEGTPEHAIASMAAEVSNGNISMEDAIEAVTEAFGDVAATKAYFSLMHILN